MAKITVTRERRYITEDTPRCPPPEKKGTDWGLIAATTIGAPAAMLFGPAGFVAGLFAGLIVKEVTKGK